MSRASAVAVVAHDLDHVASEAERVVRAPATSVQHASLAASIACSAVELLALVDFIDQPFGPQLGTLTRTARMLGELLASIDPERNHA